MPELTNPAFLSDDELFVANQILGADPHGAGKPDEELYKVALTLDYEYYPVDYETFFLDPYFVGVTGRTLWPQLLDDLLCLYETGKFLEVILTGGIGWGKTMLAKMIASRMLYETSCLRDPAAAFGLQAMSSLYFVNISIKEAMAKKQLYKELKTLLYLSPYFREDFPAMKKVENEQRFPKNVFWVPGASTSSAILGLNMVGGVLDELNFMPVIQRSASSRDAHAPGETRDYAETIYKTMISRMKSRFVENGFDIGKLVLVSSKTFPDTFLERRIEESANDPTVFLRDYATWEPSPKFYGVATFPVIVGDMSTPSRVVPEADGEVAETAGEHVVWAPELYRGEFEGDTDYYLRELAGVATLTREPFIIQWEKVMECVDTTAEFPFSMAESTLQDGAEILPKTFLERDPETGSLRLQNNPSAPRWVHIDLGLTSDAAGFAMGHIAGTKEITRIDKLSEQEVVERVPDIIIDAMLRIVPPKMGEIQFQDIHMLVYELESLGFPVRGVSVDSWQSIGTKQAFVKKGYMAVTESVDKAEPYQTLKQALYEGRVHMMEYAPVLRELRQLQWNRKRDMPDHPPRGSKDVADALCGVVYCLTKYLQFGGTRDISVVTIGKDQ